MKIIPFDQIAGLNISPKKCYEWVGEVLEKKNDAILPAKISLKPDIKDVFYNTMPAIIPQSNLAGVKVVTRYPKRVPSLDSQILLYRLDTGENLALLDGNWITAMRTGAVAVHAIHYFAKKNFKVLGMIGLGNTARATLKVLLDVYPENRFVIKLKSYKNQHLVFAEAFSANKNISFEFCDAYEQVVEGSDIVISAATVLQNDVCDVSCYKKGVLVIPIHTRGFLNCDLLFDKVYADDKEHVKGFRYFDRFQFFAEVADVLKGISRGRETEDERILVYNIGISLHDIFFAGKIYEMLKEDCTEIFLNVPKEKFWV